MWVDAASRYILDTTLVRPEEALARAAGLFVHATREPKEGPPCTPARLRVSDSTLAAALRGSIGDVELVVAPTPEIDDVVAAITEYLSAPDRADRGEASFLGDDITAEDVGAMFAAAARMYRVAPWKVLPPDVCIGVSCDILGIVEGAMVVVGQMGQAYGFSLLSSMDKARAFFDACRAHGRGGEPPEVPGHIMFGYDARDEMPDELVHEVARHGWELASRDAYPAPTVLDDDRVARGLTRHEMLGLTAVIKALADLVEAEPELAEAWEQNDRTLTWNQTVETTTGSVKVELRVPVLLPFDGSMADEEDLLDGDGELDEGKLDEYAETLLDELARMPGVRNEHMHCAEMLIMQTGRLFGVPFLDVTPQELNALLFQHLPAQVTIEPDVAPFVIEAARHMLTLGGEQLGIEAARESLASLAAPEISTRLARALAEESRYSPVKAMLMQGIREGYDLTTEQGVAAWAEGLMRRDKPTKRKAGAKGKAKKRATPQRAVAPKKPAARTKAKPTVGRPKSRSPRSK
jgi:hypothetical protein